ncbi:MAG: HK97 family phage prohead protease [Alphaproteobacteria bacterium]|nr:HK97 family phage prohead protease [Alphaproteobacteria bacterium]
MFALDMKADAQGVVEGLASPFGGPPDSFGDTIAPGAFRESLDEHKAAGTAPALLWQHDARQPIGVWSDLQEREDGLHVRGRLNLDTERGREALALLKQGALNGLSIGFAIREGGSRRMDGGGRELTAVDLWEVSLVTFPAARRARVTGVKSAADVQSRADLERFLKNAGFANRLAKSISRDGWTDKTPDSSPEDLAAIVAELRASAARFMKG